MIKFCNAKVNIGLRILGKRPDGFHALESYFLPIPISDALEVVPSRSEGLSIHSSGLDIPGDPTQNICAKAYDLVNGKMELPGVDLHLHKTIPIGAGLGGGSSNGATMLLLLNELFDVGLGQDELLSMAEELGSDVPFFIQNKACLVSGRGEVFEEYAVDLAGYWMQVVNPGIHCSTAEMFARLELPTHEGEFRDLISSPLEEWRSKVKNDLEIPAFELHPEIRELKQRLYDEGAIYASMSGSGSSVFGIYKEKPVLLAEEAYNCWVFQL